MKKYLIITLIVVIALTACSPSSNHEDELSNILDQMIALCDSKDIEAIRHDWFVYNSGKFDAHDIRERDLEKLKSWLILAQDMTPEMINETTAVFIVEDAPGGNLMFIKDSYGIWKIAI